MHLVEVGMMLVEGKPIWGQNKIAALLHEKQLDPVRFRSSEIALVSWG